MSLWVLLCPGLALAAQPISQADWHALVMGFTRYPGLPDVKGATDNANDLAAVLARQGLTDLTKVTDQPFDRAEFLRAATGLVARTKPGDTVVVAFGGRGGLDVAGSARSDPSASSLQLPGDAKATTLEHTISSTDIREFVEGVEARGGRAIVVADASFGPRGVRQHGRVAQDSSADEAQSSQDGAFRNFAAGSKPLQRSLVLSASDLRFMSGAVAIPGVSASRPALTYAVARALDGHADFDHDGQVAVSELVAYVARLVYQLSDQRQKVAAVLPAELASASGGRRNRERGIVLSANDALGELPDKPAQTAADPVLAQGALVARADEGQGDPPVRLAAATGDPKQFASLRPAESPFEAVPRTAEPDLIWDAGSRDVITGDGDLVAQTVALGDLGGVVDRTSALRQIKRLMIAAPQQATVLPSDDVQKRGNVVKIKIGNASGRALVLFNIRGDGSIRFLYPQPNDPPIVLAPEFTLALAVNDPLGADQLIAVTGPERLVALERGLSAMNNAKTPVGAVELVRRAMAPGVLVGSVGVFSGAP